MIIDWASGANAQLPVYQWPVWNWTTGDGGAAPEPPVVADTYSGGWRRHPVSRFETESDSDRKARIHAERVKLGILPPDPEAPVAVEAAGATIAGGEYPSASEAGLVRAPAEGRQEAKRTRSAAPLLVPPEAAGFDAAAYDALALDLAQLHTGAYLDAEIKRYFELQDLDDEEAMFAILALARTLH